MRPFLMLLIVQMLSVLSSCGDDATGPAPEEGDWLPLAVGNQWVAEVEGWFLDEQSDTVDVDGTMERSIQGLLQHEGGFQVYEMVTRTEFTFSNPDTSIVGRDTTWIYLRDTGDELRGYADTLSDEYELLVRFPLTLGDSWNPWPDSLQYATEVVSLDSTTEVPAGTFTGCAVLSETDSGDPDYRWDHFLHRGTGFVRDCLSGSDAWMDMRLATWIVE
jgi:hypothetical protein